MKITFIQTWWTIDKDYPKTTKWYAFEIADPAVKRILEKLNPVFYYEIISVIKKDSLDITTDDRIKILETCKQAESDKIIITHWTDTMIETAQVLSEIKNKVIVLTWAMRPERFSNSDASINIWIAIGAVNCLSQGVYIAMHWNIIERNKCKRDMETWQFILNN